MKTKFHQHVLKLAAVAGLALASEASMAAFIDIDIVKGSDYFRTIHAGLPLPGLGTFPLVGRPGGLDDIRPQYAPLPAAVDTIVERQGNCNVGLGGSCSTIPIELVGLSLQSENGSFWVREDPDRASSGEMTINFSALDGGGVASGTFDSFFDVFFEYSMNGGTTWSDMEVAVPGVYPGVQPHQLTSSGSWSSDRYRWSLFPGLVGDQAANWHTNKSPGQHDFFAGSAPDYHTNHINPASAFHFHTVVPVPEPPAAFLIGAGLLGLLGIRKRRNFTA